MASIGERFLHKTPDAELQRRWTLTLEAMAKEDVDMLVLQGFDRVYGGVQKYLTDMSVTLYPHAALFSKEGIAVFAHGDLGFQAFPDYVAYRNVYVNEAYPCLPSTPYGDTWIPARMVELIKKHGCKKVGFVGMFYIFAGTYKYLTENLPDVEFVNFANQMDEIKAVKSQWELEEYQRIVNLHDDMIAAVPTILRVGRTEREVANQIRNLAFDLGCPEVNVILGTDKLHPVLNPYLYMNNARIEAGDCFQLLIELAGPGGLWAECGRMYCMGEINPRMQKAFDDQIKVRNYCASLMVPGAIPKEVFQKVNDMHQQLGYDRETRLVAHSQSYDIVDRPFIGADDDMPIRENNFYAIHPTCATKEISCYNCDNYVIKPEGAVRLSRTPETLVCIPY